MERGKNSAGRPWKVGKLPFVYAPLRLPKNENGLPDVLPFALDADARSGVLVQVPNDEVASAVTEAYQKGSRVTGTMDAEGIGKQYAEDFLSFLARHDRRKSLHDAKILEIGCGTGYLLYRLKLLRAEVLGIEPGDHGQEGSRKYRVPIIKDFFPSESIRDRFDLIIAYGVLEHMVSPRDFLRHVEANLNERGRIAISVPDCGPHIGSGDLSMLLHEHWNYFERDTLQNCIRQNTPFDACIQESQFGGALYAITNERDSVERTSDVGIVCNPNVLDDYRRAAKKVLSKLATYFSNATLMKESVGVYVPGRALNALSIIREQVDLANVRFFDDNNVLHGMYFPGFDTPIECREELINAPTERILIMSRVFGARIAKELRSVLHSRSALTTWEDIFERELDVRKPG